MTANTGRTNLKYLQILIDNSGGTLTDLSAYLDAPGTFGLKFDEQDVTGFANAIKNMTRGRPEAPLSIVWKMDTAIMAHLTALVNFATPLALDFRIGIGHTWEAGEPTFGITGTATSGYQMTAMTSDGEKINTSWNVIGSTAPTFDTAAHT